MTLWGGASGIEPAEALWRFTADPIDRRLLVDDVVGSIAHVEMLRDVELVTREDAAVLLGSLAEILEEAASGDFEFSDSDEDIHTAVERRLHESIGPLSGRLHTGRSRNDQVCLDLRLYLLRQGRQRIDHLRAFVTVLIEAAESADDAIVASFTHLQQAQAIPFAHHLLAYAWMLLRDVERFEGALTRIDSSPLGAGASAGTSLPLDPSLVADRLGFSGTFDNSLDAVGSRDFVSEYVFCCAQAMVSLSRLAEDMVLWATVEFGWATYDDRFTTGSSALPHKKNPDIAELVRGRAASLIGDLTGLLALQKGLPLSYNRDLQEDKRAVFHADDGLRDALSALSGMVASARFHPPQPSAWVGALDLAEILVERGVPFREAHGVVGGLMDSLRRAGRDPGEVTATELTAAHEAFRASDLARLSPAGSVESRSSPGGGSFHSVGVQMVALRSRLSRAPATEPSS